MTDAVSDTSRLLVVALVAVCLSGCQTVRGLLKPYVCDCAPGTTAQSCPTPPDDGAADQGALALSQQAAGTAVDRARAEARLASESDEPSMRTLERGRDKEEPAKDPLEVIDPGVATATVDATDTAATDRLQEAFGVALPEDDEDAVVLTGNFSNKTGDELVIVRPGKHLSVYGTEGRLARHELGGELAPNDFVELGVAEEHTTAQAVRLVQDGTLQVLMHWREETDGGALAYKVGIFKVIGPFVGRLFERTLAVREADGDALTRRGAYEVLRGDAHRSIRWIPADDSGQLLTDQAVLLEWNRWEGVYRVPKPAPTAPKRDKMQSTKPAAPSPRALVRR